MNINIRGKTSMGVFYNKLREMIMPAFQANTQ